MARTRFNRFVPDHVSSAHKEPPGVVVWFLVQLLRLHHPVTVSFLIIGLKKGLPTGWTMHNREICQIFRIHSGAAEYHGVIEEQVAILI